MVHSVFFLFKHYKSNGCYLYSIAMQTSSITSSINSMIKHIVSVYLFLFAVFCACVKCNSFCPQDDPQKKENQAKSPQPKEEGSMNILNSHSPKQENNRPASAVHSHTPNNTGENAEVNMLQNNLV